MSKINEFKIKAGTTFYTFDEQDIPQNFKQLLNDWQGNSFDKGYLKEIETVMDSSAKQYIERYQDFIKNLAKTENHCLLNKSEKNSTVASQLMYLRNYYFENNNKQDKIVNPELLDKLPDYLSNIGESVEVEPDNFPIFFTKKVDFLYAQVPKMSDDLVNEIQQIDINDSNQVNTFFNNNSELLEKLEESQNLCLWEEKANTQELAIKLMQLRNEIFQDENLKINPEQALDELKEKFKKLKAYRNQINPSQSGQPEVTLTGTPDPSTNVSSTVFKIFLEQFNQILPQGYNLEPVENEVNSYALFNERQEKCLDIQHSQDSLTLKLSEQYKADALFHFVKAAKSYQDVCNGQEFTLTVKDETQAKEIIEQLGNEGITLKHLQFYDPQDPSHCTNEDNILQTLQQQPAAAFQSSASPRP